MSGSGLGFGFVRAVAALGGDSLGGDADWAGKATDALLDRWREPHRRYHDERHLTEVLRAVDELTQTGPGVRIGEPGLATVMLAAWYHDAVYEGRPGDDEEASARLVETELPALGVADAAVAEVAALVRSTAGHALPEDEDTPEAVLHDADLWILAAPPERFDAYCADVRLEYAHVGEEDFGRGRTAALTPFASRERLYATEPAERDWSDRARANLARELQRLRA